MIFCFGVAAIGQRIKLTQSPRTANRISPNRWFDRIDSRMQRMSTAFPQSLTEKSFAQLLLALIATTCFYRAIGVYFQSPVIYSGLIEFTPYFSGRWFLQFLMDIGFASGAAIMIKQFRLQLAGKEKEKNLIRDKLETELKFLRNQTNPHFLFNTLNNIYALARKKSDETADVVIKLSKLLRFMLYEAK